MKALLIISILDSIMMLTVELIFIYYYLFLPYLNGFRIYYNSVTDHPTLIVVQPVIFNMDFATSFWPANYLGSLTYKLTYKKIFLGVTKIL